MAINFVGSLEGLSDEPLRRAAQIALAAIDATICIGDGNAALDAAYQALQTALATEMAP